MRKCRNKVVVLITLENEWIYEEEEIQKGNLTLSGLAQIRSQHMGNLNSTHSFPNILNDDLV